jgi:hypothetical protein
MSFNHRYLWSTDFITNQLRHGQLEEATAFRYFLAIMAFDWLQFTLIATTPSPSISPWSTASSWSTFVITVLGLFYLYRKNGGAAGRHFLHRYFPLSVTVGWKFVVTMFAAVWLIPVMLQGQSDEALGWCTSAALAVINTLMFLRIGMRLESLAKTGACPPK